MQNIFNENKIIRILKEIHEPESKQVESIISKANELKGLSLTDTAYLLKVDDEDDLQKILNEAKIIKQRIYGNRLVLFAPLYLSNECVNNCLYCAFRRDNKELLRKTLAEEEIEQEVKTLEEQGHKRLLLVTSDCGRKTDINFLEMAVRKVYETKVGKGEIRRVNVNAPEMDVDNFKRLKAVGIGTYQLFQETYHRKTFEWVHPNGKKSNYDWHITAMDRAQKAGIDDVGIGVLFGLYDYKFEVLALLQHAKHLEEQFGVGPHTISVPRIEPALNAPLSENIPYSVSDKDFIKLVAILRLAVPYTGIILTTREKPELRNLLFELGVSQISAGSRTSPGAYHTKKQQIPESAQFSLGDQRTLDEVIAEISRRGYFPSFCTACYRLGRTGQDFMSLAKPGLIQNFCTPNAVFTFKEYLEDYASEETRKIGETVIEKYQNNISNNGVYKKVKRNLEKLEKGERDLYF